MHHPYPVNGNSPIIGDELQFHWSLGTEGVCGLLQARSKLDEPLLSSQTWLGANVNAWLDQRFLGTCSKAHLPTIN